MHRIAGRRLTPPHAPEAAASAPKQWRQAYRITVLNAALFLVLAAVESAVSTSILLFQIIPPLLFFLGSIICFVKLIRNGGELAAVSYYVLGAGVFFGFGTGYAIFVDDTTYQLFFSSNDTHQQLNAINLLNAVSITLALLVAWPFCLRGPKRRSDLKGVKSSLYFLTVMRVPLMFFSLGVVFLQIVTFPSPSDLLLRNFLSNASYLIDIAILLFAMQWSEISVIQKLPVIVLIGLSVVLGILSLSKTQALVPIAALCGGLILDMHSRRTLVIIASISTAVYFFALADAINLSRNDILYLPDSNTIAERIEILSRTWSTSQNASSSDRSSAALLQRVSAAPYQSYLIKSYDSGVPGNSLSDAWAALIPRMLWPDKPSITRFGGQLDGMFFRRDANLSSLAPTYTAEAYWNWGWLGVVLIALLMGVQIGWFTSKWHKFTHDGERSIGVFLFAIPIVLSYFWLEAWIAASYIGGFVTLVVLVKTADVTVPAFIHVVRRQYNTASPLLRTRRAGS